MATATVAAYDELACRDPVLAGLVERVGRPDPFHWGLLDEAAAGDAFAELALHVVSQQISLVAARAIFARVAATAGALTPDALAATPFEALRAAGLSGAKARSLIDLAQRVLDGRLDFDRLAGADDDAASAELQLVRGVGPWSAQMFLLHHLRRPDVFPAADIGLQRSAQAAFGLDARPSAEALERRAERWRPYRSYAAALLWAGGP